LNTVPVLLRGGGIGLVLLLWGLWLAAGNGINCLRVAPNKAIELCTFEMLKRTLCAPGHPLQRFAAPLGGAAGMAGTVVTYPLEVMRTRISLQVSTFGGRGLGEALRSVKSRLVLQLSLCVGCRSCPVLISAGPVCYCLCFPLISGPLLLLSCMSTAGALCQPFSQHFSKMVREEVRGLLSPDCLCSCLHGHTVTWCACLAELSDLSACVRLHVVYWVLLER